MKGSFNYGGRPYLIAIIDCNDTLDLELRDRFKRVLKRCRYREKMAICRSRHCGYNTILNWQFGRSYPKDYSVMLAIIRWFNEGKPCQTLVPGAQFTKGMF